MPLIYLRHPVHSTKIANMELEAVADEANGWTRYDPNEAVAPASPPAPLPPQAEPVAPAPQHDTVHNAMEPRRRGRPRKE